MVLRERRSINIIYEEWNLFLTGQHPEYEPGFHQFETLIKAFRGLQEILPGTSEKPAWNSFFNLGGYHGQPFLGKGTTDKDIWGGYCNHNNVLFPTWHRAYLLNFEDALRSIAGCEDVTLPFWDELLNVDPNNVQPDTIYVPEIFTQRKIKLRDEPEGDNPLYSYRLKQAIDDKAQPDHLYSKQVGYETVRYPLSGLVGTPEARKKTDGHNAMVATLGDPNSILNANVGAWLTEGPMVPKGTTTATNPNVYARFWHSLQAPNYTVFSNWSSQREWNKLLGNHATCVENPHDAIHIAVGAFYQRGQYNPIRIDDANGDMGANEMAGFDPIFFFHHCFIDYVFWRWQVIKNLTSRGSLSIDYSIGNGGGTTITKADAGYPLAEDEASVGKRLTMETPLHPFRDNEKVLYTSYSVTNIEELGYKYGLGSLDSATQDGQSLIPFLGDPGFSVALKQPIFNINRADYPGSFVIRVFGLLLPEHRNLNGRLQDEVEVAREAVLGRLSIKGCRNCQDKLEISPVIALDQQMLDLLQKENNRPKLRFVIQRMGEGDLETPYEPTDEVPGPGRPAPFIPVKPSWPTHGPPKPVIGDPI